MGMIDADKLHLKLLDMEFPIQDQDQILDAMDDCTVDAAPVVHGRWEYVSVNTPWIGVSCSICKRYSVENTTYCPSCGAKMDLPEKESTQ